MVMVRPEEWRIPQYDQRENAQEMHRVNVDPPSAEYGLVVRVRTELRGEGGSES